MTIEDTHETTVTEALLGDEARKFMDSDLCRYMIGIADQEIALAQEALENVPANDTVAVMELQFKAKVARQFKQWLDETIDKGDSALEVLREQK